MQIIERFSFYSTGAREGYGRGRYRIDETESYCVRSSSSNYMQHCDRRTFYYYTYHFISSAFQSGESVSRPSKIVGIRIHGKS